MYNSMNLSNFYIKVGRISSKFYILPALLFEWCHPRIKLCWVRLVWFIWYIDLSHYRLSVVEQSGKRNMVSDITWHSEKPTDEVILAKLTESFTCGTRGYEILHWNKVLKYYYDSRGEEIPIGGIDKWAKIE